MARIAGKDTRPEIHLRQALWQAGIRYRLHVVTPAGRPDVVIEGRVAVFIDGCFWHGCPRHYVRPRSRTGFWSGKLRDNFERDLRQTTELRKLGWGVCRVWEHEILEALPRVVRRIRRLVGDPGASSGLGWRVVAAQSLRPEAGLELWTLRELRRPRRQVTIERVRTTGKRGIPARRQR